MSDIVTHKDPELWSLVVRRAPGTPTSSREWATHLCVSALSTGGGCEDYVRGRHLARH